MGQQGMSFAIDCQWLDRQADTPEDETLCWLKITAGDHVLTRNKPTDEKPVNDAVVVSAWPLASWLAGNWWRLCYETGAGSRIGEPLEPAIGWEMAHYLPSADFGYLWPNLRLISDDRYIRAEMDADPDNDIRLTRYVDSFRELFVDRNAFVHGTSEFLRSVDSRLLARFPDDPLRGLIAQLFAELDNKAHAEYRMIEAMTGYDPDEAPEQVIAYGRKLIKSYGQEFFSAMASAINLNFIKDGDPAASLENILNSARQIGKYGVKGKFALGANFNPTTPTSTAPWDYGRDMAKELRKYMGLEPEQQLATTSLREWFELSEDDFKGSPSCGESGICNKEHAQLIFRFANESSWQYTKNRRFFLGRLAAACLSQKEEKAWLAIGPGATWEQRMQRAFAAELLAPIEGIKEMLPARREPIRRDIEKIASHYCVSNYTVVHSLANQKEISRKQAEELVA